jgi:multidrug resistance protein, MATE family
VTNASTVVSSRRTELRRLLALGGPVAITQLGAMMLGVVDTMMVGHVGVVELGAAALGTLWIYGTVTFGMGVLFGLDPVFSQAHGSNDARTLGLTLQRGIVIAVVLSIPLGASWLYTEPALRLLGQPEHLVGPAHRYVVLQIPSLLPFLVFQALRQYLQGRGIVAPALWITLAANLFNAAANWVLVFGHLGVPALGLTGAAIATALTRVFLCLALGWIIVRFGLLRGAWVGWSRLALDVRAIAGLLRLGLPVGIQYSLEVWAFQAATLLAGWLGPTELAAHVIALNLASLSFMVPLGLSIGAATRVGNLIGARQHVAAQRSAEIALGLGASVMTVSALGFALGRHLLPLLYTSDPAVLAAAALILPIAAAFQLFDGTQAVGAGVLRGMGSTLPAAVFNLVGFYGVALPLGWFLVFRADLGLPGLWWGLCAGLGAVASCLVMWVRLRGPATHASGSPPREIPHGGKHPSPDPVDGVREVERETGPS